LPTPNLFSGTENAHGKYEFVTLETMAKSVDVIMAIAEQTAALQNISGAAVVSDWIG
jgi:tripeptide aminopeptidase